MLRRIKTICLIALITISLFEGAIAASFYFPKVWKLNPNPFVAQKLYRSQRNVVQFMPECAEYDGQLGYKNRIGRCEFSNYEFDTNIIVGESGRLSVNESEPYQNDYECNVVFLGDSITFGWGVEQKETFSHLIGKKFGCKVFNLGVSSYGTARQVIDLNRRGILKTDVPTHIFLQYCDNDFKENSVFKRSDGFLPVMSEEQYKSLIASHEKKIEYYFPKYLWVLASRVFQRIAGPSRNITNCSVNCDEQGLVDASENAELGAFLYSLSKLKFDSVKPTFTIFELNGTNRNDCDFSDAVQDKLAEIKTILGDSVSVLPTCGVLTSDDYFILDDHMNARGHTKFSNFVIDNIEALVKK